MCIQKCPSFPQFRKEIVRCCFVFVLNFTRIWSLGLGFDLILPSDNINTFTLSSEQFSLGLFHRSPIWITIHHKYLLCTSPHILQTIFNFCYFILIAMLFDYAAVNFNKIYVISKLWGDFDTL